MRILMPRAKVSPAPIALTLGSEPEVASRCVFGVALETLRKDQQMVCGIPLVLRDMVEFLDKNGKSETQASDVLSFLLLILFSSVFFISQLKSVLTCLCTYINASLITGMHHRGLFRLCGSVLRTRQLRQRWDCGERVDLEQEGDVPTVASLLKLFLRELPCAIVPEPQRKQFVLSLSGTELLEKSCLTVMKI